MGIVLIGYFCHKGIVLIVCFSVTQVTGNCFDWLFLSHKEDRIVLSDCFSCRSSWKLF